MSLTGALRHLRAVGPERTDMRLLLSALASFVATAAFAHSGHGEIEAMHHGIFSPLNGLEPLAAVTAGLALIAYVAWKRS
jgi:hydrogenase/urease accessory protein HupE